MKNRIWVIIFSVTVLVCTAVWIGLSFFPSPSKIVGIYQNGSLVKKIDLTAQTGERTIELNGNYGKNIISITHDRIEMRSADCPDKLCVKHGELKSAGSPIVCLPNRIIIKFENQSSSSDAEAGALL